MLNNIPCQMLGHLKMAMLTLNPRTGGKGALKFDTTSLQNHKLTSVSGPCVYVAVSSDPSYIKKA